MKVSAHFLWFDAWVGFFWDKAKRILYFAPLPCCVLKFDFGHPCPECKGNGEKWGGFTDGDGNLHPILMGNCPRCDGYGKVHG